MTVYLASGTASVSSTRNRPKTVWSPSLTAPFANAPSRLSESVALPPLPVVIEAEASW